MAVNAKFDEGEWAALSGAAVASGWSVGGYMASAAVAMARGEVHPLPADMVEAMAELGAARERLRTASRALNACVAALHSTGRVDAGFAAALERCEGATAAMDQAAQRIGAQHLPRARPAR